MSEIKVKLKSKQNNSYKILIEKGCVDRLPSTLKKLELADRYAIVTDDTTRKLFGNSILRHLKKGKIDADIISFKAGEKSKSLETIGFLAEQLVEKQFTRKTCIIALGGGVVGDVAGFLSAIYLRGVPYIQIPTTLLAMVDSAVGGKTGVDLKSGKNLLGTFTQPKAVFIDTKFLKTLPVKQIRSGLAEVIKYGVIWDKKLFKFIERNLEQIFKLEEKTIVHIIEKSLRIKTDVVHGDEKETGNRIILNYGHTYGHVLEQMSNYTLLHGFAISIGMVWDNKMAVEKGILKQKVADRISNLFKAAGLPTTTMHKPTLKDLASDKKRVGKYIKLVLPKKIGKVTIHQLKCL